MTMGQLIQQNC